MKKENNSNKQICSICGKVIPGNFGNNAQPVNNGICCNSCSWNVVLPARIRLAYKLENNIKD